MGCYLAKEQWLGKQWLWVQLRCCGGRTHASRHAKDVAPGLLSAGCRPHCLGRVHHGQSCDLDAVGSESCLELAGCEKERVGMMGVQRRVQHLNLNWYAFPFC